MNSFVANQICCAWLPCCQPGTEMVDLAGVDLEFCAFHVNRAHALEWARLLEVEVNASLGADGLPEEVASP